MQQKKLFDHPVGSGKQRRRNVETERALAVLRLPPISDRNFEDDLAFGVTFLDILVRCPNLVEVKHLADFGLDLAGIDQGTNLAQLFPALLNGIMRSADAEFARLVPEWLQHG